ncbi:type IV pilin protein [Pseudomonadota bacterium]
MASKKIASSAFTLLELMIVVAIVGTLLTIAIPSYQQYIRRAHRADAIRAILAAAECQGRIKAQTGYFNTTQCLPKPEDPRYEFRFEPADSLKSDRYTLSALPLSGQEDSCNTLSFHHTGTRGISHPDGSVSKCWGGR